MTGSEQTTRPILGTWMMVWQLKGADAAAQSVRRSFSPELQVGILAEFERLFGVG